MKNFSLKVFIIMLLCVLMTPNVIFAAEVFLTESQKENMSAVIKNANSKLGNLGDEHNLRVELRPNTGTTETNLIKWDVATNKLTFDEEVFNNATPDSRKKVMSAFVESMQDSPINKQTQQSIMNTFSANSSEVSAMLIPMLMDNTSADIFSAMRAVSPIMPAVRLLIGIAVILLVIYITVTTVADLAFIGLPIGRESMGNNENGKKIPLVSSDAMSVVKEVEGSMGGTGASGGYRNAYLIYFKRRALTWIILSFCIIFFLTGEIGRVISWFMSLGSGLFN